MTTLKDAATQPDAAANEKVNEVDAVDAVESEVPSEDQSSDKESTTADETAQKRPIAWKRVLAYGVLPGLALVVALATGYLKWLDGSAQDSAALRAEAVRIGSEDAVALLSYKPESVDKDLGAARERLTGDFKDAYTALTRQVVIPGAKEKHISAVAKASAAASVSATASHAIVLVFVNQTVTVGEGVPTDTAPVVRVVLDKVNDRWLVSHFDPV
jgi:Mce-associated membrane protein